MRHRWVLSLTLGLCLVSAQRALAQPAQQDIVLPELLEPLNPAYPPAGHGDASVELKVTLDQDGAVTDVEVIRGDEPYTSAAIRAARQGKFAPARRGSRPIASVIRVLVEFTYSEPEPEAPAAPEPPPTPRAAPPTAVGSDSPPRPPAPEPPIEVVAKSPRLDDTERPINKAEARLTAGTFGDPVRAIELLPGITPLISGVPFFFVRGAPPGSVNFYIDEARVPQLYHVGPGSSILHPQLVEGVALRSGPYRARYGDATSGVVTTRLTTNVPEASAEVEAKVFESSAYVAGPILERKGNLAIAGKTSHLGPVLEVTNPDLSLHYWDYQALGVYRPSRRDQISLLAFGARDFVGERESGEIDVNLDSLFHRVKLGYNRNLAEGVDLQNHVVLGQDESRFDADDEEFHARSLLVGSILTCVVDDTWEWALGLSADATDYDASDAENFIEDPSNIGVSRVDTEAAVWGEGRWTPTRRATMDAGLRVAYYGSLGNTAVALEPRLTSSLTLTERLRSILSVGYSTQTPSFTVPAPAVRPAGLEGGLQQALQRAGTVRYGVPGVMTAEGTVFYNTYLKLSDPLSLSTVPDPLEVGDSPGGGEPPKEDLNFEDRPNGRSVGLELMLRRPFSNRLSGTLSYTLSRSTRRIGSEDVPSSFDRTHLVNLTGGYDFGSGYNFSARVLFYSGVPVRQLGETGGRTGDRSDPFLRLDVRFSKQWHLRWGDLMFVAEMLNAAFQKETLGVSCTPDGCATATFGPVSIPSIGLRGTLGGAAEGPERAQFE